MLLLKVSVLKIVFFLPKKHPLDFFFQLVTCKPIISLLLCPKIMIALLLLFSSHSHSFLEYIIFLSKKSKNSYFKKKLRCKRVKKETINQHLSSLMRCVWSSNLGARSSWTKTECKNHLARRKAARFCMRANCIYAQIARASEYKVYGKKCQSDKGPHQ